MLIETAQRNYRSLIDDAFDFNNIRTWAPSNLTAGGMMNFKLYVAERWTEESKMCTMLFEAVSNILLATSNKATGMKLAKRFLLCHWVLRIQGALSLGGRKCVYVASSKTGLQHVIADNGPHSMATNLDNALKGAEPATKKSGKAKG